MKLLTEKQIFVLSGLAGALTGIMLFGILFGSEYPQMFFWGFMVVFVAMIVTIIIPKRKDFLIFIAEMAVLGIFIEFAKIITKRICVTYSWQDVILTMVIMALPFALVYNHFIKMIRNSKLGKKVAERNINK